MLTTSYLLKTLEIVSPAIGRADVSPQLANLWFDGKYVTGFDDTVAITTNCELPIEGGVKGALLLSLLSKHDSDREIIVSQNGEVLDLAIGKRTKAKLAIESLDARGFPTEESMPSAVIKCNKGKFLRAMEHCVKCVGTDISKPEYFGITLEAEQFEGAIALYSGDTSTLVEAVVPIKSTPAFKQVVLPVKFCQQLLKYYPDKDATLEVIETPASKSKDGRPNNGYALLKTPYVTVYGRNLLITPSEGDSTPDFFERALKAATTFMPMPPITKILERAAILDENRDNLNLSVVEAKGKRQLKFYINKENTELTDISNPVVSDHEPIKVLTSVKNIKHGSLLQEININSQYIIMRTIDGSASIVQLVGVEA